MICFKSTPEESFDTLVINKEQDKPDAEELSQEKKMILCAFCLNAVTDISQIISVNGSHQHVFVNPHGLVFDTGCFKECDGCILDPRSSSEFSWFHGYIWHIAGCSRCRRHLGWFFLSDNTGSSGSFTHPAPVKPSLHSQSSFYCLILENLIIP